MPEAARLPPGPPRPPAPPTTGDAAYNTSVVATATALLIAFVALWEFVGDPTSTALFR